MTDHTDIGGYYQRETFLRMYVQVHDYIHVYKSILNMWNSRNTK